MSDRTEVFYGELRDETDKGYLVFDGINEIWIPRSQIKRLRKVRDNDFEIEVPLWLAEKEGII